jgi:hypothetical protein
MKLNQGARYLHEIAVWGFPGTSLYCSAQLAPLIITKTSLEVHYSAVYTGLS